RPSFSAQKCETKVDLDADPTLLALEPCRRQKNEGLPVCPAATLKNLPNGPIHEEKLSSLSQKAPKSANGAMNVKQSTAATKPSTQPIRSQTCLTSTSSVKRRAIPPSQIEATKHSKLDSAGPASKSPKAQTKTAQPAMVRGQGAETMSGLRLSLQ